MSDADLEAYCARLESDLADLAVMVQQLREELTDAVAGGAVQQAKVPSDAELVEWVRHVFGPTFARDAGNAWRWCAEWAQHPEAVLRLGALFTGWQEAQASGRMLGWLRDVDVNLAALSSPDGPFASCTPREHRGPLPLPTT